MDPEFTLDDEDTGTAFNEEEFADPEADAEMKANDKATEETLASMTDEATSQPADVDADYMNEVERRLDVASYYRELLASPIFENGDENAQIVEDEIRRFATGRLQVLIGLKKEGQAAELPPPPAKPLFVEAEVQALRGLARLAPTIVKQLQALDVRTVEVLQEVVASVLKRREAASSTEPRPPRPTIRPKPAPAPAVVQSKPEPVVAKAVVTKPIVKPAPRPVAPRPAARPAIARRGTKLAPAAAPAPAVKVAPKAAAPEAPAAPPGDGRMHQVRPKNHNVRQTGPVPFPTTKEEMESASASFAVVQARAIARAADGPEKATNFAEG